MDHEVIRRPCKICGWLLNSSSDHFSLHQGTNVGVTVEFEVPKDILLRLALPTDMIQQLLLWKWQKKCYGRKGQGPMAKNVILINFSNLLWGREDEDKRIQKMVKLGIF